MEMRTELAVIPLLLALLAAGCEHGQRTSARDRADARAFVKAGRDFGKLTPAMISASEKKTAATFHECSLVRLGVADLPPASKLAGLSLFADYQALLPAYGRYALRLTSIHAHDATLRVVAQAAAVVSRHYGELRSARPDYCRTLRAWQAAGWREDFSVLQAIGISENTFDVNGSPRVFALRQAEKTIAASGERLRQLGVVEDDVMGFLLATDVFAAGRGGYTEIARLARD